MMADKIGWGTPIEAGRGRGLAIAMECYGSITGQAAEVTVDAKGKVKVDRMVVVMDCYHAANPNTIHQQMEGGAIFGLTQTLYGQITIKDGAAQPDQLPQLPARAHGRDPGDRDLSAPVGRAALGRRRRAGRGPHAAGDLQRGVCGDRKKGPPAASGIRGPDGNSSRPSGLVA